MKRNRLTISLLGKEDMVHALVAKLEHLHAQGREPVEITLHPDMYRDLWWKAFDLELKPRIPKGIWVTVHSDLPYGKVKISLRSDEWTQEEQ